MTPTVIPDDPSVPVNTEMDHGITPWIKYLDYMVLHQAYKAIILICKYVCVYMVSFPNI